MHDSQSEKSDYIIKRFIGKKKQPILTVFTSKKGKRPYSPLKKETHAQTGHCGAMLLNEWLHGEEPFTTTSD